MKQKPYNAIVEPSILTENFELFRKDIAPPEKLFSNNIPEETKWWIRSIQSTAQQAIETFDLNEIDSIRDGLS